VESQFLASAQEAILLTLLISFPPIVAALVVGLVIASVQALTQIQEQTLQVAAKILVVFAVLFALGGWMASNLHRYARVIFENFGVWVG